MLKTVFICFRKLNAQEKAKVEDIQTRGMR